VTPPKVLVTTPLYDGRVHYVYLAGLLSCVAKYGAEINASARMGSFLPRLRDLLTSDFVRSKAEYMLSVDSDVGWSVAHLEKLLAHDRDFVAGVYPRKLIVPDGEEPGVVTWNGETDGELRGAHYVGAGFMLIKRCAIVEMIAAYGDTAYPGDASDPSKGIVHGLWSPIGGVKDEAGGVKYLAEDYSLCHRYRVIGGKIWVDPAVRLAHVGEHVYRLPEVMK
jgi:hypothetical protein